LRGGSNCNGYLRGADVTFRLDPFHVNRAILLSLPEKELTGRLIGLVRGGEKEGAVALLKGARDLGLDRGNIGRVVGYLERHLGAIALPGPSLGTMESTTSTPVAPAWTRCPAAGRSTAPATWAGSSAAASRAGPSRAMRSLERAGLTASQVVQSVGSGYEPPHRASLAGMLAPIPFRAGLDAGMAF